MAPGPVRVCGVDGAPGGWALVEATVTWSRGGRTFFDVTAHCVTGLESAVQRVRRGDVSALAIDMPIGLLDQQHRAADTEARRLLGPRRSSVFPAPVRATLGAHDYESACARSRRVSGKALSKQAFNLLPKVAELDELIVPTDQHHIVEAHPELAFARLAGGPLDHPKRSEAGRARRLELLREALGLDNVGAVLAARCAPAVDLIDAMANVSTAAHVAANSERRLPIEVTPEIDATGKRTEIVW